MMVAADGRILRRRTGADVTVVVLDSLNHLLLPAATGAVAEYSTLPVQALGADVLALTTTVEAPR